MLLVKSVLEWQKVPRSHSVNEKYVTRGLWSAAQLCSHPSLRIHVFGMVELISHVWGDI